MVYGEQMMLCSKVFWVASKVQDYLQMFARNHCGGWAAVS